MTERSKRKSHPLSEKEIPKLTSQGKAVLEYQDSMTPGLLLRVTATGQKTWGLRFKNPVDGVWGRMHLGRYGTPTDPIMSLSKAREAARGVLRKINNGIDPRVVEKPPVMKTIAQLIDDRLKMEVFGTLANTEALNRDAPLQRTAEETEWLYAKYVTPVIGDVAVKDFDIGHLTMVIDPIMARGKPSMAQHVFMRLSTLMNFARGRGIKCETLEHATCRGFTNVRERFLSLDEIITVWNSLPTAVGKSRHCATILRLILTTGQRSGEVAGMNRREIDTVNRIWTIPAGRAKNGKKFGAHAVPLNDLAFDMITDAMRKTNGDYLFPCQDKSGPLNSSVLSQRVRLAEEEFGIPHWTPHDLRRTVGTQMLNKTNGLGISRFDKALVLNHRSVTKANVSDIVYDHNEYLDEKREALDKWGAFLAKLIAAADAEAFKIAAE